MQLLIAFIRQYWLNLIAIAVFVAAAWQFWSLPNRFDHFRPLLLALGGMVAIVASDEWMEYTGRYGFTRSQFYVQPEWLVRLIGMVLLASGTIALFRL